MRNDQAVDVARGKLAELTKMSSSETVKVKLQNIGDVCELLVIQGRQRLTIPLLLSTYSVRYPGKNQSIAESTIRNKRPGGNPYQELYRTWVGLAEALISSSKQSNSVPGAILNYDDLGRIPDLAMRHQVQLLITQNTSLKSQLQILKQVRSAPVVRLDATHPETLEDSSPGNREAILTEGEIDAIKDFLSPKRMASRGLTRGSHDGLLARSGQEMSDPGFLAVLQKVVEHFAAR